MSILPPATAGTYHVVAASQADNTKTAVATVTVHVAVTVSPLTATVTLGQSQTFAAVVTGATNTAVNWSVQEGAAGGSITSAGVYKAPATAGTYHIVATQSGRYDPAECRDDHRAVRKRFGHHSMRGNTSMRSFLLVPFGILFVLLLAGCGGGSNTQLATTGGQGRATLTVTWPARTRLIPDASNSIAVVVKQGTTISAQQTLARPAAGGTSTASFASLPTGTLSVTATAYPNADGTGVAQATATVPARDRRQPEHSLQHHDEQYDRPHRSDGCHGDRRRGQFAADHRNRERCERSGWC